MAINSIIIFIIISTCILQCQAKDSICSLYNKQILPFGFAEQYTPPLYIGYSNLSSIYFWYKIYNIIPKEIWPRKMIFLKPLPENGLTINPLTAGAAYIRVFIFY